MPATVIVGAGAAGIVAAIFASERSSVTLVERTSDGGRKILISGGGRCNVLPVALEPDRFVTESPPHLLRGMLRAWPLVAQREFFERDVGVPLTLEEETGKLFPVSGRARDVRDGLIELARRRGVQCQWDTSVTGLTPTATGWSIETTRGVIDARAVVLATGGLSVPKTGSDGTGIRLATRLGHVLHDTYPALTPLIAEPAAHASLAGVSLNVRLRAKWRGKVGRGVRRIPVHPSRIQRAVGARPVAHRCTEQDERRRSGGCRRVSRRVVGERCRGMAA